MPMFNSDILPDVTGRAVGSADKQYDGFFRNINVTGAATGAGLNVSSVLNAIVNTDTLNLSSDNGSGMTVRMRITNPASGNPAIQFKNSMAIFGGIADADSRAVPIQLLSSVTDTVNAALLTVMRQGNNTIPLFILDAYGRMAYYGDGTAQSVLTIIRSNETGIRWAIDTNGTLFWGPGGAAVADISLSRVAPGTLALGAGAQPISYLQLGQIQLQIPVGQPPMVVTSNTLVPNLNADLLDGADWASPPTLGGTTPNSVRATTISASAQISSTLNDGATPPLAVASTVPVDVMRVRYASNVTIEQSIINDGSGVKHRRVATGSIAAGASANITITWATAFADANYTTTVSMFDAASSGGVVSGLRIARITQQDGAHITVMVINDDGAAAHTGTIHAHAIRG